MAMPKAEQPGGIGRILPLRVKTCNVGYSQEVHKMIRKIKLSNQQRIFMDTVWAECFNNAGYHVAAGFPEHSCPFDLVSWQRELEWHKSAVHRTLHEMIARQIITADLEAGRGRLYFNLNFDQWVNGKGWGGSRAGAGKKSNQVVNTFNQVVNASTPANPNQVVNGTESSCERLYAVDQIKLLMPDWQEVAPVQASHSLLIKVTNKRHKDLLEANASLSLAGASDEQKKKSGKGKGNKEPKPVLYDEDSVHFKRALALHKEIAFYAPKTKLPDPTPAGLTAWSDTMRLMVEGDDKRDPKDIGKVVKWIKSDSFWKTNILSPSSLRRNFDKLIAKCEASDGKTTTTQRAANTRGTTNSSDVQSRRSELAAAQQG